MNGPDKPSYLAEPTIQYLLQVVEQLHAGELELPRFQRFGVWKPQQRTELLRSIRDGIPIGTLLIWRTRRQVTAEHLLGVHVLPKRRTSEGPHQYVLDGVQRLSALYQALFPADEAQTAEDGETADDFTMYFDLREQEFCSKAELGADGAQAHHLPLTTLRDSVKLLKFQRRLTGTDADRLTERADNLYNAFRNYKVPIVPLASDDLAFATKSFQRINTQGTPMSEVHMVNALVYSKDFDLLERLHAAQQETLVPVGWGEIENETLLRTIKALLGLEVYSTDPDKTCKAFAGNRDVVDEAVNAVRRVAEFLAEEMKIHSPNMVPYGVQIVLLARVLHGQPRPSTAGRAALRDWVSLTTYTELFAGNMSNSRFERCAEELGKAARGASLVWSERRPLTRRPLPPNFDFRHARARLLALRMARARHESPDASRDAKVKKIFEILAREGRDAVAQLFTPQQARGGAWRGSPGARVVAVPDEIAAVREQIFAPDAADPTLQSYLIPRTVHELLREKRYEEAVEQRTAYLNRLEEDDFHALLARHADLR